MDINRLAEVFEEVVKILDHTQNEKSKLDHVIERLDTVQNYIEEVKDKLERLNQKTYLVKTQIFETRDKSSSEVEIKDGRKLQGQLEQLKTSITYLAGHLDTVEKSMATVLHKIKSVETSLNDGHKTVKEDLLSIKEGRDLVTTKVEQPTNEVKDDIYWSKHEKEAQIVRDRIEGPLSSCEKYLFDFYVENFKTFVRSGKDVYSPTWYINDAKTSVEGWVRFQADGNIKVFFFGRHPREVGLQPRPARRLKVKATICDVCNKVLPDILVGQRTVVTNETRMSRNGDWGWSLGVMSCDDVINKGFGEMEGYEWGSILVRYDVTFL